MTLPFAILSDFDFRLMDYDKMVFALHNKVFRIIVPLPANILYIDN